MRVLVLYAHPVETSYQAALHDCVVQALGAAGHEVDDFDLYAEAFDPRLTREERLTYHDMAANTVPVQSHVDRLRNADGLVLVFPVWNFGFPAILKGFFDRVFLPGVSFRMENGEARSCLNNIGKIGCVTTYGATRVKAFLAGDPPRKIVTRVLRATARPSARIRYLAHYDMNRSTDRSRATFLERVGQEMSRF